MREFAKMYAERLVSAEEFERMPDEDGVVMELVRGRVVRMVAPGHQHGRIATRILVLLAAHVEQHGLGEVLLPTGFKIESNPDSVRVPDIAFIARRNTEASRSFVHAAPDLAVEVKSPTDRAGAVRMKVAHYLETGVRMVWLVEPARETVTVFTPGAEPITLMPDAVLDGRDVVPGFACSLRRIFT